MINPKLIDWDFINIDTDIYQYSDITLRDLFAGVAMLGIGMSITTEDKSKEHIIAEAAYNMADAMLAERINRMEKS